MKKVSNIVENIDNDKLKKSFIDECKDKEFKSYISGIAKDEILMKYTSRLKDSFIEHQNCENCKSLTMCKNSMNGYKLTPHLEDEKLIFSLDECDKLKKYEKSTAYTKNINYFEIPKDIQRASFKDVYRDDKERIPVIKFFKEFMDNYEKEDKPKGLYLHGSFGSGKTYLVAALFNELAKKGIKSSIVYYPELLRNLKGSFGIDFNEKFNDIKKSPILLLDDIGAENVSSWSRDEILGPILQYRMEENLPTFFTSNLNLEELESNLSVTKDGEDKVKSRRIIERIKFLTKDIDLVSVNRRK